MQFKKLKLVKNFLMKNLKVNRSTSLQQPLQGFQNNFIPCQDLKYQFKKLDNGCDILLETPTLPGYISFNIVIKGGVNYENQDNSGYFNWLQKSIQHVLMNYPHIFINTATNVEQDYFILQSHLISDQIEEYLQVLSKCFKEDVLQERVLYDIKFDNEEQNDVLKTILQTAYNNKGIGKPIQGLKQNYNKKDQLLNTGRQFHEQIINNQNVKFLVSGIYNQEKFLEIVNKNFGFIKNEQNKFKIEESYFVPQHLKENRVDQKLHFHSDYDMSAYQIALGFPLENQLLDNQILNNLVARIIGECSYFISSGPGTGVYLLSKQILNHCQPATYTGNIYHQWQDKGLMGFYIKAIHNQNNVVLQNLQELLRQLQEFPNNKQFHEYFQRAKNILKREIISDLEMQQDRLCFITQRWLRNQEFQQDKIIEALDAITFNQVRDRCQQIFNQAPSIAEISNNQIDI